MRKEPLYAIPGTSIEQDLHNPHARTAILTPGLTMPVFALPKGLALTEAIAVTFRDESGKPVDGGLFGITPNGEVVEISLVDQQHDVNTDDDPAHIAMGLLMTIGEFTVRGENSTTELPWSVIDFGINSMDEPVPRPTPSRLAVHAAYCARQQNETMKMSRNSILSSGDAALSQSTYVDEYVVKESQNLREIAVDDARLTNWERGRQAKILAQETDCVIERPRGG